MIPLRDNIRSDTTPVVNYLLIAVCGLAFLFQLSDQTDGQDHLVESLGMIPERVFHPEEPITIIRPVRVQTPFGIEQREVEWKAAEPPFSPWLTLLTCMFLHGGWMHFLGNMWFLHIFGDNVESRFGHFGYLAMYLGCGVASSAAHLVANASSTMPTIGASGAIAGVMGAYLLLFPRATVLTLVPIVFFLQIMVIPAPVFLIIWFALQFFQGTFSITAHESGGVAWWAHVGGFAAGVIVAWFLNRTNRLQRPPASVIPNTQTPNVYRYSQRPWS